MRNTASSIPGAVLAGIAAASSILGAGALPAVPRLFKDENAVT